MRSDYLQNTGFGFTDAGLTPASIMEELKKSVTDQNITDTDKYGLPTIIMQTTPVTNNLIKDSFMRQKDDKGNPTGFFVRGDVKMSLTHPYTQGFEGPYKHDKADSYLDPKDHLKATKDHPVYFGRYNKGPRLSRGGLADGWAGIGNGNIMKITKKANSSHSGFNSFGFKSDYFAATDSIRFMCYLKIVKGTRVGFGTDSGYSGGARGIMFTKEMSDKAENVQGWIKVDINVNTSRVVNSLSTSNFLMGFDADPEYEVYLALPTLYIHPISNRNFYHINSITKI